MENETRSNLKISGVGSAGGGKFNEVTINGTGSVNGDIECFHLDSNGASDLRGNVNAKSIKINGTTQIKGNVTVEHMDVNGTVSVNGNVDASNLKVSGSSSFTGSLRANSVDVKGAITMDGSCEADTFKSSGGFNIGGMLNADTISINIYGGCRAKEIGGENIDIRRPDNIFSQIQKMIKDIFNMKDYLLTDTIEGDNIYLESTTARVVRGNNVAIGPNCSIELVEYKETMKVVETSRITEQRQV